MKFILKNKRN
uniref:Uncharacterized protein n=1 Tax=Rhizophora mucronata TaxID=61149 RepID=A0A2P2PW62_RHIMU